MKNNTRETQIDAPKGDALGAALALLWRAASGHPFGSVSTDATFWRPGTRIVEDNRGRFRVGRAPSVWTLAPHRTRLVLRWTVVALIGLWVMSPAWMALPMTVICGALLGALLGLVVRRARTWRHRRNVVDPLSMALAGALGEMPPSVTVPTNWKQPGAQSVVSLPEGFLRNEATAKAVRQTFADRLGLPSSELVVAWHLAGATPFVTVSRRAPIPTTASPRDPEMQRIMDSLPDGSALTGLARGGRPVVVDFDSDSPHFMMGAGSGGGKSITVGGLCSQQLRKGATVTILDTKVSSHPWAHDLKGQVPYFTSTADIHDELVRLGAEMQARNDRLDGLGAAEAAEVTASFQRQFIVIEEINTLSGRLKKFWTETREKTDPKDSPALAAFVEIANMGRSVKCHLVLCGQRLSVAGIGGSMEAGSQIRASCGVRIVARYDAAMWRMVMDGAYRSSPGRVGRAIVQVSGKRSETQLLFWDGDDAAVWARGGTPGGALSDALETWQDVEGDAEALAPVVDLTKHDADETQPIATLVPVTQPLQIEPRREVETLATVTELSREIFVRKSGPVDLSKGEGTQDAGPHMPSADAESEPGDTLDGDAASFEPLSMREWVTSREFGTNVARGVDVLKSARKRDPKFPSPVATDGATNASLFDPAQLDQWAANRQAGTRLERAS